MFRLSFPEYRSLLVGALAGVIAVWLVWIGIEIVLRSLTAFAPLSATECLGYLHNTALPSAVLGAATALSWCFTRSGQVQSAQRLRLVAAGLVGIVYVWQAGWEGAIHRISHITQDASGAIHTEVTTTLASHPFAEAFQRIVSLFFFKNYPFLWAFLMLAVSSLWLAREAMKQQSELTN